MLGYTGHAIITIGIAGSGKTTYLNKLRELMPFKTFRLLCRDDIRATFCPDGLLSWKQFSFETQEEDVSRIADNQFNAVVASCENVMISETNLNTARLEWRIGRLVDAGFKVCLLDFTGIPLRTIIERNAYRHEGLQVPEVVIQGMAKTLILHTENLHRIIETGKASVVRIEADTPLDAKELGHKVYKAFGKTPLTEKFVLESLGVQV